MIKTSKLLKTTALIAAAIIVTGCATTAGTSEKQDRLSATGEWDKTAYGIVFYATDKDSHATVCHAVNFDKRCLDDNYVPVLMAVSFGFAEAGRGLWGFAHKNDLKDFVGGNTSNYETKACTPRSPHKCFYGKFSIPKQGLATFEGIVQKPGQKTPCDWDGLPGHGGVVCESLGFDYRKAKLPVVRNW